MPETFRIGGDADVRRLGTPTERENALRVLRRAVELGVNLVDTAHAYVRTEVNARQIAKALDPYSEGLVIATKGGLFSSGSRAGMYDGRPEALRANCEGEPATAQAGELLYETQLVQGSASTRRNRGRCPVDAAARSRYGSTAR